VGISVVVSSNFDGPRTLPRFHPHITWGEFSQVWVLDYEFYHFKGGLDTPLCYAAKNILTGEIVQEIIGKNFKKPLYPINDDNLYICFTASAEWGCHLALNLPIPTFTLDTYVEFLLRTNGKPRPYGTGLLGACEANGINGADAAYKEDMRQRILEGPPYSDQDLEKILLYNKQDVLLTELLFYKLLPEIDWPYALVRDQFMGGMARIQRRGSPVSSIEHFILKHGMPLLKDKLITNLDKDYDVYENGSLKLAKLKAYMQVHNIPWGFTPTGRPKTDYEFVSEKAKAYPQLENLKELMGCLSQVKLNDILIGPDGRNRCQLKPFMTATGRNAPSNAEFIYGPAKWLRFLITCPPGYGFANVDYSAQEIGVAARLSGDQNLLRDYWTGDPYITFSINTGILPKTATKNTHSDVREKILKQLFLGTNYGSTARGFAERSGLPYISAKIIYGLHQQEYPQYWAWAREQASTAMLTGEHQTPCHWKHYTHNSQYNSLLNFPMQATGSDILHLAVNLCDRNGIEICATLHDALFIQAPLEILDEQVKKTQLLMEKAAEIVIGMKLRTDAKVIKYPEHYIDKRGIKTWNLIWTLLKEFSPQEKQQFVKNALATPSELIPYVRGQGESIKEAKKRQRQATYIIPPETKQTYSYIQIVQAIQRANFIANNIRKKLEFKNGGYRHIWKYIEQKQLVEGNEKTKK